MKLAAAAATDQGRVRANNEDAFLIDDQRALFAVADGMGGHRGGEVASHTAIEALRAAIANGTALKPAIIGANDAVIEKAGGDDELTGMGTTLTAILAAAGNMLLIGHVGDSRAYLLRKDKPLERMTDDHSLVEELVREGRLTPEQAESHPQRAIVTRALGVTDEVDVDALELDVELGDRIVLCSDGLTTMVRERDIERIARTEADPQQLADALVAAANDAGGEDNITVVVIDVLEVDSAVAEEPQNLGDEQAAPISRSTVVAPPDPPDPPVPRAARAAGSRGRAVRATILVLLPLLLILGAATAALGWYARSSYYVGQSGDEVVIYKGVPGGVLGWNPTVDEHTGVPVALLPALDRDRVQTNSARGSLATAQSYVLRLQFAATSTTTTTTTETTTTTTRPKRTTTTTVHKAATP